MKKWITLLLLAALALTMLSACGKVSEEAPVSGGDGIGIDEETVAAVDVSTKADNHLDALLTSEPSSLDCARFLGIVDRTILHSVTEPLTRIENGIVTEAGAESFEVSEDGLVYTFHLRENHWSDGVPVTANDYVCALLRQSDPANAWSFASDFFCVEGFEERYNGEDRAIGAAALDDDTLVITLNAPNPAFLSTVDIFPCRQDMVDQFGDAYGAEAESVLSCGPFTLDSWVHNSALEFSKNELYWDAANVALDGFTDHIITDEGAQMSSLENGSLDYAAVSAQEYADTFAKREDMYELRITTDRTAMIVFNCEDELFQNAKVRLAFSLALDRDLIVEIVAHGLGEPAFGLVPTVCYVGDVNFREVTPEPLRALAEQYPDPKALLAEGMEELGLGSDPAALTVTLSYGGTDATARTNAELYQQMWQYALGVTVEVSGNDSATHLANVREGSYQIATVAWGSTYEPQFQLSRWATPTGGQSRWVNEEYVGLVSGGSADTDDAGRLAAYQQAEALLIGEAAIAPTYYNESRTFAYNYVSGIPENPFDTTGMKTLAVN